MASKISATEQLREALKASRLKIKKVTPSKTRSITMSNGGSFAVEKFIPKFIEAMGENLIEYPDVFRATHDVTKFTNILRDYAEEVGILNEQKEIEIPEHYNSLVLNLDHSHPGRDLRFFMTTPDEYISSISGYAYLRIMGMKDEEALAIARKVTPEYRPRSRPGIVEQRTINKETLQIFNSYVPPEWMTYEGKTPDKLPPLFEKLVNHLFPSRIEREYFYAWLYASLFERAFVYLILCGPGGTGKNRLKLVMRALHGHQNSVDGKKSTLTDRFNSQFAENTIAWFDELTFGLDEENAMKEVQNDSISIERKGVDATRSTKIFSSIVISNNKPRDNYIAFDARKFVPLQINNRRLETSMTPKEIGELTAKVEDWASESFDLAFIAQIGRWIQKHGKSNKWFHLEYKGPMFYKLAHTSMSRWQKKAASLILSDQLKNSSRIIYDAKKGYLWSSVADQSMKKNGDRSLQFPDFSTVQHFFDIFVDGEGKKAFETMLVKDDIMGDFWVKLINKKAKILTEAEVLSQTGADDEEIENEEDYDL